MMDLPIEVRHLQFLSERDLHREPERLRVLALTLFEIHDRDLKGLGKLPRGHEALAPVVRDVRRVRRELGSLLHELHNARLPVAALCLPLRAHGDFVLEERCTLWEAHCEEVGPQCTELAELAPAGPQRHLWFHREATEALHELVELWLSEAGVLLERPALREDSGRASATSCTACGRGGASSATRRWSSSSARAPRSTA